MANLNKPKNTVPAKARETLTQSTTIVKLDPATPAISSIIRIVLVVLIVISLWNLAQNVFVAIEGLIFLIILAIFLAYLLVPLVDGLQKLFAERQHESLMPRWVAISVVYLGVATVLWFAGLYIVPSVSDQSRDLAAQVPGYAQTIRIRAEELNERYKNSTIPPQFKQEIENSVSHLFTVVGEYATEGISAVLIGSITYLPWVILIPIFGFFFLKDGAEFSNSFLLVFPEGDWRGRAEAFVEDLNRSIAAYTRAQLISCLLIGTVCTTAFSLLGVRYALLLGILAGILEFIPLVGPLIIGVIAVTVSGFESFNLALGVGAFLLILRLIHDYVTYPRIVRQGIHLHPLAVILSVLAGGEIGGIVGIFLAIPVVAVCTVVYKHIIATRKSSAVMAEILEIDTVQTEKVIEEKIETEKDGKVETETTKKTETKRIEKETSTPISANDKEHSSQ